MLVPVPLVEGIVAEQGADEDPLNPADAALEAVVFAPWLDRLGASPGNCTADCGLTDAEALLPSAPPPEPSPVVTEPLVGGDADDVEALVDGPVLNEAVPDAPVLQPSAIEGLLVKELPAEHGAPGRLAAFTVAVPNAPVPAALLADGVPVAVAVAPDVVPV
jgi:hypothetical protein